MILLVRDSPHPLLRELADAATPIHVAPYAKNDPRVLLWLTALVKRERYDLVHSFLWRSDATVALMALLSGFRAIVCSERGDRSAEGDTWPRQIYDRFVVFPRARGVCANSRFSMRRLIELGCPPGKTHVIPNGVDLGRIDAAPRASLADILAVPSDVRLVGYVGRLHWNKGVDTLLEAFAPLRRRHRQVHLVIAGDGPERETLQVLARRLGIDGAVTFAGYHGAPARLMKGFDVGVLPTVQSESCSNTVLEYMACGVPVVATDVGGNPELVVDGDTGWLVPPRDPAALAEALTQALEDPARAAAAGERGRERVEREFSMERTRKEFERLWLHLARGSTAA